MDTEKTSLLSLTSLTSSPRVLPHLLLRCALSGDQPFHVQFSRMAQAKCPPQPPASSPQQVVGMPATPLPIGSSLTLHLSGSLLLTSAYSRTSMADTYRLPCPLPCPLGPASLDWVGRLPRGGDRNGHITTPLAGHLVLRIPPTCQGSASV